MGTINQVKRDRVEAFRQLKRTLKAADTSLEVAERFIERVIGRKNKIPTIDDLEKITNQLRTIDETVNTVVKLVGTLTTLFGAM